ncbi:MAG TPA: phage holin family protein [Nitrospira sp.]|nr:phage holin family protein [Nitrospira sp.]
MDTMRRQEADADREPQPNPPGQVGVLRLVSGIMDDLKKLVCQQAQLAIHEVQMEADRVVTIVTATVSAIILVTLCATFLLLTAVAALHEMGGFSLWKSCGVVALMLMVLAGSLGLYIRWQTQRFRILPARSLHTVKEDLRWIKEWLASPRM